VFEGAENDEVPQCSESHPGGRRRLDLYRKYLHPDRHIARDPIIIYLLIHKLMITSCEAATRSNTSHAVVRDLDAGGSAFDYDGKVSAQAHIFVGARLGAVSPAKPGSDGQGSLARRRRRACIRRSHLPRVFCIAIDVLG
jgi:hypothetical protein